MLLHFVTLLNRRHDFYSFVVGLHFPVSMQNFYYGVNAFILEMNKLPHVSRERSVCLARSLWWEKYLQALEKVYFPSIILL